MATRGRTPGFKMPEEHRAKIKITRLLNLLEEDALGVVKLEDGRRRSIEILLRKALPDLSAVEQTVHQAQPFAVLPAQIEAPEDWEEASKPKH